MAVNLAATADVTLDDCVLLGFFVNSTSSGTVLLKRGGSTGVALMAATAPAVGYHPFPADCPGGLHFTEGNTIDITFFIQPYGKVGR
jgi:hypothetical protein